MPSETVTREPKDGRVRGRFVSRRLRTVTDSVPQRAGDDDRQATVRRLEQAMVEGRISLDEMEDRMGQAYRASTWDQLDRLTHDLPAPVREQAPPATRPIGSLHVGLLGDVRRGGWIATEDHMTGVTLLGDVVIDLASAQIPDDGVTVAGVTLLGDVRVIVPDGARVKFTGLHLLGDRIEMLTPPSADGSLITIRAINLLGDLEVYSRSLLPESRLKKWWLEIRGAAEQR